MSSDMVIGYMVPLIQYLPYSTPKMEMSFRLD